MDRLLAFSSDEERDGEVTPRFVVSLVAFVPCHQKREEKMYSVKQEEFI